MPIRHEYDIIIGAMGENMAKVSCADITNPKTRARLEKAVKRLIADNKKVFDNLAKK